MDTRLINHVKRKEKMTREQINTIFTDLGIDAPQKGVVTALLNAFNQEKGQEIETAKKTANDEAAAKYKDYIKPEDHQKIVEELNAEKGKGALAERKAKYQKANLNIEDEDIFNLIEGKLKDSKDFDKDLETYVKAHPSFVKPTQEPAKKNPPAKVTVGGAGSDKGAQQVDEKFSMQDAVKEFYGQESK